MTVYSVSQHRPADKIR